MTEAQKTLYYIAENMKMDKSISDEGYEHFQQAIKALDKPSGKWITYKDEHQCSCCKEIIIVSDDYWNDNEYDYCPYCGVKMEQGEIK